MEMHGEVVVEQIPLQEEVEASMTKLLVPESRWVAVVHNLLTPQC